MVDDEIIEDEDEIKEAVKDEGEDGIKVEDKGLVEDVVVKDDIKHEVLDEINYEMKDEIDGWRGCMHGGRRRHGDAVFATCVR